MQLNLEKFLSLHGKPENTKTIEFTGEERAKIPGELIELYDAYGLSSFASGFLWFVHPFEYREDVSIWLEGQNAALPFMRTAFGSFFYLDGDDLGYRSVVTNLLTHYNDLDWLFQKTLCKQKTLNDVLFFDIYGDLVKRDGSIERDECYGFFPPVALGGEISVESAKRVKLREHLAFLSQL